MEVEMLNGLMMSAEDIKKQKDLGYCIQWDRPTDKYSIMLAAFCRPHEVGKIFPTEDAAREWLHKYFRGEVNW